MRFEDTGFFWEPFKYQRQRAVASAEEKVPRVMPPIPDTGWKARAHFPDLSGAKVISLDTETCDPDLPEKGPGVRRGAYMVGVSLATDDGFKIYYPFAHSIGENLDREPVLRYLRDQLGRANQPKVGANLMYDLDFLAEAGVQVAGRLYDVLYADPLIYEYSNSYSLDAVAERRLGKKKEGSLLYQWCADAYGGEPDDDQRKNIWRSPASLVGPYAEQDALLPLELIKVQVAKLREMGANQVFEMECKLIPLLLQMRRRGVPIDLKRCQFLDDELSSKIELLKQVVVLDPYSGDQIRMMCDAEGIIYPRTAPSERHPTGQPSFTKDWLNAHTHPKLKQIADLRKLYKMRDSFIRGALLKMHVNGRIHCEFNPLRSDDYGTVSGRFSSSHPNLQQIPVRDSYWGPRIRSCFVPDPGCAWYKNDLSQIEFRLGVHYGVGPGIEDVRNRYRDDPKTDFYKVAQDYTALPRQDTKSIALGTLYGMRHKKFARMTGKSEEEAKRNFDQFNEHLPFMHETYDLYMREAEAFGFVTTIGGRICHLDADHERKALNRKLQGSCADWMKRSMLNAYESGVFDVIPIYLTVHDETDCGLEPTARSAEAARELHHIMQNAYSLNIPVYAGCDLGSAWGELDDLDPAMLDAERIARAIPAVSMSEPDPRVVGQIS